MSIFEITIGSSAPPPSLWTTILTGLAVALGGGIVLFGLNWLREYLTARWTRQNQAGVLAFTVASQIDQFVSKCFEVVAYGYDFDPESGQVRDKSGSANLSFSDDLPWGVFDKELQHRIRSLPNEIHVAERTLAKSWDDGDGYLLDVLQEREELYAQIGLNALELNSILHKRYGVPLLDRKEWRPEETFRGSLKSFADARDNNTTLRDQGFFTDLLPGPSEEELRNRMSALSSDLKAAMDRTEGHRHA
ncbi:hypothetical protein [Rhizobium rhizogenes]|uniref:hypothetical protein n=1 Tax=Rhizobium rhizogenes TaxID=359 RepID=UPI001573CB72|nr:hypothetical protein [Rhizobium rhizogenes]NTF64962.1 hypothetical protein [Rhizobium rhizogenes]NTG96310.1 hypothetical protein [Rhizobium rhizogenes]